MRRRLLAVLLVLQFTPMLPEFAEWASHYLVFRDFVHAAEHQDEQNSRDDEHGCTPAFHACACHAATSSTAAEKILRPRLKDGPATVVARLKRATRDLEQPPLPPPIV